MPKRCKLTGKVIYVTKSEARSIKNAAKKNNHKKFSVYLCGACGFYHLTSKRNNLGQQLKSDLIRERIKNHNIKPDESGLYHVLFKGVWHLVAIKKDEKLVTLGWYIYNENHEVVWLESENENNE